MSQNLANNKYQIDPNDFIYVAKDQKVYRIIALRDLETHDVKKGDRGGYIESRYNLSCYGDSWVKDNAYVCDAARVLDDALICDEASASGDSTVSNWSIVSGRAKIAGKATISHYARVTDDSVIEGLVYVSGYSVIVHNTKLAGEGCIYGYSRLSGVTISGNYNFNDCFLENFCLCFPYGSRLFNCKVTESKNILIIHSGKNHTSLVIIKEEYEIYVHDFYKGKYLLDHLSNPSLFNFIKYNFGE